MKIIDGTKWENIHFKWKPDNRHVETVGQDEEFRVIIPDSSTMQIEESYTTEDMSKIDGTKFDGAVGPIFIEGAEKGDTLEIDIEEIIPGKWGWTAILNDMGLFKGEFDERLLIWDIGKDYATTRGDFLKGVRIPVRPFLGVTGLAPESGEYGMIPPQYFGGNMDNRLLTAGTRLYLPVSRNGALLSVSDPHAYQGDGEMCGTAIETSAEARFRVRVLKGEKIPYPRASINDSENGRYTITMGVADNLLKASRLAAENMFELLKKYGLSRDESYALCSVAGNLRISELVDEPNYVVSLLLADSILESL